MFHLLSKALSPLIIPTNGLVFLMAVGLLLIAIKATRRRGLWILGGAASALVLVALAPAGDLLLSTLEDQNPPFAGYHEPVAGIIVLGGSISTSRAFGAYRPNPNDGSDRLFEAARLARLYPNAPVIIAAGPVDPKTGRAEADDSALYLARLGVAPTRIRTDRASRDTYENAVNAKALAGPRPDQRWLLVTSAFHMPRAAATFRTQGFSIVPAPCDWRTDRRALPGFSAASEDLQKLDVGFKEYEGLLAYALTGRIDPRRLGPRRLGPPHLGS